MPAKILAGALPKPKKGLRLNIKELAVKCQSPCQKSTTGRFEVKMSSRDQLNKLFGRALAFAVILECPEGPSTMVSVKVFVDRKGRLREHR